MLKLKQPERMVRILCYLFAAGLAFELVRAVMHLNPLSGVSIPAVPSLNADSKTPDKGTNAPAVAEGKKTETNSTALPKAVKVESNAPAAGDSPDKSTNSLQAAATTNASAIATIPLEAPATNAASPQAGDDKAGTNAVASAAESKGTTNSAAIPAPDKTGTNLAALAKSGKHDKQPAPRPDSAKSSELPPVVQARVDRIIDSEILAPVMHPMPSALLGIAGEVAFLRSPSGETGLVKEGDNLGSMKLLRIGINRVLVEEQGEKKELMIFSGFGGDSLLPKQETPK